MFPDMKKRMSSSRLPGTRGAADARMALDDSAEIAAMLNHGKRLAGAAHALCHRLFEVRL